MYSFKNFVIQENTHTIHTVSNMTISNTLEKQGFTYLYSNKTLLELQLYYRKLKSTWL